MAATIPLWLPVTIGVLSAASIVALLLLRQQARRENRADPARIARAVQAARAALARVPERRRRALARARMRLAMVLTETGGRRSDPVALAEARDLLAQTIPALEEERLTGEWATAVYYRGRAEWGLGAMRVDTGGLELAVATFRHVLTLKKWPRHLLRAVIVSLPAVILTDIGERRDDTTIMQEGVAMARDAVATARRRIGVEWCIVHRNLSQALAVLGRRTGDRAMLEEALAAARVAIATGNPRRYPGLFMFAQASLGFVLSTLGETTGDRALLEEAVAVLEAARSTDGRDVFPEGRTMLLQSLGGARLALGRARGDPAMLDAAADDLRAAMAALDAAHMPFPKAETGMLLGEALAALGDAAAARAQFEGSRAVFTAAGAKRQAAQTGSALARLDGAPGPPGSASHIPVYQVR